jgi:uncharacterized protein
VTFGLTVGLPLALAFRRGHLALSDFGQQRLLTTIGAEVVLGGLLWVFLARRGWALARVAGAPRLADVPRGVGVTAVSIAALYASTIAWFLVAPGVLRSASAAFRPHGHAALWVIAVACVVNPLFEEFLWLAYGLTALETFGLPVAMLASIALRTMIHSYQGMTAIIAVLPVGVVFTVYYARTRRLWPVIVAHIIVDTIGLLRIVRP